MVPSLVSANKDARYYNGHKNDYDDDDDDDDDDEAARPKTYIHSFSILFDDRAKASSKTIPPHSAI